MNKLYLYILLITSFSNVSFSQQTVVDSLQRRIETLEKLLNDKNYSRVPNVDLDKNLDYIVTEKISSKILYWMGAIGAILAFGGFSLLNFMKNSVKDESVKFIKENHDEIKKELKETKILLEEKLKNEKEILTNVNISQDNEITKLKVEMENRLQNLTGLQEQTLTDVDLRINNALKILWDDIANNKYDLAEKAEFNGQELINDIKTFLENKSVELSNDKKVLLVDCLMRCYYHTATKDANERNIKMIALLNQYENEKELKLMHTTYANAAIALINTYEFYGSKDVRASCIECCNKSLALLSDYGLVYALLLEVYMIDYKMSFSPEEKQAAEENLQRTFKSIENNKSTALCIEILMRIDGDKKVEYLKTYIDLLEDIYSDELMEIKDRACKSIIENKSLIKIPDYENILKTTLEENSRTELKLQGNWRAVKIIEAGTETPAENIDLQLLFNQYIYQLKTSAIVSNGYSLMLPYKNKLSGINFYQMIDEQSFQKFIPAIYKFENDRLILCSNYFSSERPVDFSSTPENKYYVEIYERVMNEKI